MRQVEKIGAPDESKLTPVKEVQCQNFGRSVGWIVTFPTIWGPDGIFSSEKEELLCRTEGLLVEWWSCGNGRTGVEDLITELYRKYYGGTYTKISWFKR